MDHADTTEIIALLSAERLESLRKHADSDLSTLLMHQQLMQLGTEFMTVIGVIEIALRNKIHNHLCDRFETDNWLLNPPDILEKTERLAIKKAVSYAKRVSYSKLHSSEKRRLRDELLSIPANLGLSSDDIAKECKSALTVSSSDVLTQLSLSFWKALFSVKYEQLLWDQGLKTLFPNKTLNRSQVARHLEKLYQARNRIAHHELVYGRRLNELYDSITFISHNFMVKRPSDSTPLCVLLKHHMTCLDSEIKLWDDMRTDNIDVAGGSVQ